MSKMFPNLFSPGKIGNLVIKNRVIKAPQSTGLSNMDGTVSERLLRHYKELAKGGTGLIIVEYAFIDKIASKSCQCQLGIADNEMIPGLSWLADVIRDNGSIPGIQIEHCGRQKFLGTQPIKSASSIAWPAIYQQYGLEAIPQELTIKEIHEIENAFGDSAMRAVNAGFELIEIHGAHGYLITNFLSPHTNHRTDMYGGNLENRMRFVIEIVRNIRKKIGPNFPLTIRLSGTDYEPDGFGINETIQVSKTLEKEGIDAIHVSGGDHQQMIHQVTPMCIPVCHNTWAAEAIKKEVNIPVIASGSITLPKYAEDIIASGKGDFVGLGRPLWADQYWPKKAMEDRPEDISPCIRCNEGCLERTFFKFRSVTCAINPTIGREGDLVITPAEKKKNIAVIGGGPAGMEFARVSKLRGHNVTIFEKHKLGGYLNDGSVFDFKSDIIPLKDYLITQIKKLNIKVINEKATIATINKGKYDAVVLATGAIPIKLNIPGSNNENVFEALDVINNLECVKQKAVIIGGGLVGTELAIALKEKGKDVTIIEMMDQIMNDCATTDKIAYGERILKDKLEVRTGLKVEEIKNNSIIVISKNGTREEIKTDTVIIAVGMKSDNKLCKEIEEKCKLEIYTIGDCVKPRKIFDAMHTGYKTALRV